MIRAALAVGLLALLAGCAGQATYNIHPFYDQTSKQFVCCEAIVANSKDIATVTVHATKSGDTYTFDFQETGVGASGPIAAQSAAISDVSDAVTNAAISAVKLFPN